MRNLLLCIFCTLCFAAHTHAQYGRGFNRPDIAPIIGAHHTASKTTASNKRLAMVAVGGAVAIYDSSYLFYSGNRGGTFDSVTKYWTWNCDEIYGSSFYMGEPDLDNAAHQWYTYNAAGKMASWRRDWYPIPSYDSTRYLYDTSGRRIQDFWMIRDTSGVWNNYRKIRYEYDTDGKLVLDARLWWESGVWKLAEKFPYVYNDSGKLVLSKHQVYFSPGGWQDYELFYHGYAAGDSTEFIVHYMPFATADTLDLTILSNIGPFGQPESKIIQRRSATTGTFVNEERYTYSYTSDGMPATEYYFHWDASTNTWSRLKQFLYYYETYDTTTPPPTEIAEQSEGHLKIYPVPAKEKLTIAFSPTSPAPLSFSITDMNGRLYQSWSTKQTTEYKESISISNLPVGTYVLECSSSTGTERKKFVVEK